MASVCAPVNLLVIRYMPPSPLSASSALPRGDINTTGLRGLSCTGIADAKVFSSIYWVLLDRTSALLCTINFLYPDTGGFPSLGTLRCRILRWVRVSSHHKHSNSSKVVYWRRCCLYCMIVCVVIARALSVRNWNMSVYYWNILRLWSHDSRP